jgi:hypothetical protein
MHAKPHLHDTISPRTLQYDHTQQDSNICQHIKIKLQIGTAFKMEHYLSKEVVLITITDQEHETGSMHYSLTEIQRK